nr:MAG TPA: hypothetical protein [Caudoviricetes sp.]
MRYWMLGEMFNGINTSLLTLLQIKVLKRQGYIAGLSHSVLNQFLKNTVLMQRNLVCSVMILGMESKQHLSM